MARFGQEVRIAGGMKEFIGRLGTIVGEEGSRPRMYRVRLHEPVEVPGVGEVTDDLWQGAALKAVRGRAASLGAVAALDPDVLGRDGG